MDLDNMYVRMRSLLTTPTNLHLEIILAKYRVSVLVKQTSNWYGLTTIIVFCVSVHALSLTTYTHSHRYKLQDDDDFLDVHCTL